jgi:hypothetical protein
MVANAAIHGNSTIALSRLAAPPATIYGYWDPSSLNTYSDQTSLDLTVSLWRLRGRNLLAMGHILAGIAVQHTKIVSKRVT